MGERARCGVDQSRLEMNNPGQDEPYNSKRRGVGVKWADCNPQLMTDSRHGDWTDPFTPPATRGKLGLLGQLAIGNRPRLEVRANGRPGTGPRERGGRWKWPGKRKTGTESRVESGFLSATSGSCGESAAAIPAVAELLLTTRVRIGGRRGGPSRCSWG